MAEPITYFSVWNSKGTYLQSGRTINAYTPKAAIEIFLSKYDFRVASETYPDETFYVILLNEQSLDKPEEEIREMAKKFNVATKVIVHYDIDEDRTKPNKELVEYYKKIGFSDDDIDNLGIVGLIVGEKGVK